MYCSHCGKKIDDRINFCPHCGARVGSTAQSDGTAPTGGAVRVNNVCADSPKNGKPALHPIAYIAIGIAIAAVVAAFLWFTVIAPSLGANQDSTAEPDTALTAETNDTPQVDYGTSAYDASYFTFAMPDIWQGLVSVNPQGHSSGAYHVDFYLEGTGTTGIVWRVDGTTSATGSDACVPASLGGNYAAKQIWQSEHGEGGNSLTDEQLDTWLYVTTGGLLARSDIAAFASADEASDAGEQASAEFYAKTIEGTVQAKTASEGSSSSNHDDYHVTADHYEFDIPEYWQGKVAWSVDGDTVTITANDAGDETVLTLEYPWDGNAGDIASDGITSVALDSDNNVSSLSNSPDAMDAVWISAPYLKLYQYKTSSSGSNVKSPVSDEVWDTLIDLQTNGSYNLSSAINAGSWGLSDTCTEFIKSEFNIKAR